MPEPVDTYKRPSVAAICSAVPANPLLLVAALVSLHPGVTCIGQVIVVWSSKP